MEKMKKIILDANDISVKKDKINLTLDRKQWEKLKELDLFCFKNIELSTLNVGEEFLIGNEKFIVLDHENNNTKVLSKYGVDTKYIFGRTSNWIESSIRYWLNNEYFHKIASLVGDKNIIRLQKRNLISLDGLTDYGTCQDTISLLTVEEYAKYHKNILHQIPWSWWWTITPFTTPSNNCDNLICIIGPDEQIEKANCNGFRNCDKEIEVRPYFILKSSTRVLLKEENKIF